VSEIPVDLVLLNITLMIKHKLTQFTYSFTKHDTGPSCMEFIVSIFPYVRTRFAISVFPIANELLPINCTLTLDTPCPQTHAVQ